MGFTGGFSNTTMNGVLQLITFSLELADLKSGYGESDTWIMVNKHLYNYAAFEIPTILIVFIFILWDSEKAMPGHQPICMCLH